MPATPPIADRPLRVLAFGAGVQSSALALMMAAGEEESVDFAIFADTHWEPNGVYAWIDEITRHLPFPLIRVSKMNLGEETLRVVARGERTYMRGLLPLFLGEDGKKTGMTIRKCTRDAKIRAQRAFIRAFLRGRPEALAALPGVAGKFTRVEQVFGISYDEADRMKDSDLKSIVHSYPLVDRKITREDCLIWMRDRGYREPTKSACVFCPYHDYSEWLRLKRSDRPSFDKAVAFEKRAQSVNAGLTDGLRSTPWLTDSCRPLDTLDLPALAAAQRAAQSERAAKRSGVSRNTCGGHCER